MSLRDVHSPRRLRALLLLRGKLAAFARERRMQRDAAARAARALGGRFGLASLQQQLAAQLLGGEQLRQVCAGEDAGEV